MVFLKLYINGIILYTFFSATCLNKKIVYFLGQKKHIYKKTEKLVQRVPIYPTPSFPCYYCTLLWYMLKQTNIDTLSFEVHIYLDFLSFSLMFFFGSRIPSRILQHILFSCVFRLILAVAVSQTLFLMIFTALRKIDEVLRRMAH